MDALPLHRRLRRLLRSILRRRPVPERLRRGVGRELHDMSHGHLQHLSRHGKRQGVCGRISERSAEAEKYLLSMQISFESPILFLATMHHNDAPDRL